MADECRPPEDDEAAVVRLGDRQGWVRLWNPRCDDVPTVCAEIGAPGMTAIVHGVVVLADTPVRFLAELAESFEGWSGTKAWRSLDRDLRIEAVFGTGGHVAMTWTVAQGWPRDAWSASVTVRGVEAGEEMRRLAVDMRELLGDSRWSS